MFLILPALAGNREEKVSDRSIWRGLRPASLTMSNLFGINQSFENRTPSGSVPHYSGPSSPLGRTLAYLGYAKQQSRIVDQWLIYISAEESVAAAQTGEVTL